MNGAATQHGNRRERLQRFERQFLHDRRQDGVAVDIHQQGVTIGWRVGDDLAADHAVRARLVLDHDIDWPSASDSGWATKRAMISVTPPGA